MVVFKNVSPKDYLYKKNSLYVETYNTIDYDIYWMFL